MATRVVDHHDHPHRRHVHHFAVRAIEIANAAVIEVNDRDYATVADRGVRAAASVAPTQRGTFFGAHRANSLWAMPPAVSAARGRFVWSRSVYAPMQRVCAVSRAAR